MSVVRVSLLAGNAKLGEDESYNRTFTHEFLVETSSPNDGQLVVYNQMELVGPNPVPALWSTYNYLTGTYTGASDVFLQSREIVRLVDSEDAKNQWKVTCTWSAPQPGKGGGAPTSNPLSEPVRYQLEWTNYTRLVDVDVTGAPIVNGAGDEFDPPVQRDDYRPVLVATRNMWPLQSVINLALTYKNVVNSSAFYGAPAGTAKVESISSGPIQERNGQSYYAVTIKVQFTGIGTGTADPTNDWLVRLVNRGRHFIGPDGSKQVPYETELKNGASPGSTNPEDYHVKIPRTALEFVNLKSDGKRKFPDYAPAEMTGTAYQIYPSVNFAGLGI